MEKLDIILNILERMESDIKALKAEGRETQKKLDKLDEMSSKLDLTWQAVMEIQNELTDNSLKIKIIDNKVKAL
ncbi:MAG TPA: hypothetical protein GX523_10895 [Desulfitobacterium dehalogenans]|uniref:Uncharacterized protein n=1 Tax=Desulfitobacterium dehalogenans TaxID=36854 RepID=A0A7C7D668_9FIRM|nr:hypothetical protein [Desulfitobacterium dehalogenans]